MIIGFSGTRQGMSPEQKERFAQLIKEHLPSAFMHGDCIGADAQAHEIVHNLLPSTTIEAWPPTNSALRANCPASITHSPLPYRVRNKRIVDNSDLLIACPNTSQEKLRSGTWMTIRLAITKNKHTKYPLFIILPFGNINTE